MSYSICSGSLRAANGGTDRVKEAAGHRFYVWEVPPGRANEALDPPVYAHDALRGLLHFGLRLNVLTQRAPEPYGDASTSTQPGQARRASLVSQLA